MRKFLFLALAAAALLVGCDQKAFFESLMPKDEVRLAQEFVAKVAARDYAAIESALKPELRSGALHAQVDAMAAMLPAGPPESIKAVGSQTFKRSSETTYVITLEYEYADRWLLAAVRMERQGDHLALYGVTFEPRHESLGTENRFTLEGKGPLHFVVLTLAIAFPLFVIYALVVCIRTKFAKRKWPWVLFILIGLTQFQFNWTSGAWDFLPVAFMFLGSGFFKSGPYAPWVFSLAFPLGAALFLYRRPALQRPEEPSSSDSTPQAPEPTEIA